MSEMRRTREPTRSMWTVCLSFPNYRALLLLYMPGHRHNLSSHHHSLPHRQTSRIRFHSGNLPLCCPSAPYAPDLTAPLPAPHPLGTHSQTSSATSDCLSSELASCVILRHLLYLIIRVQSIPQFLSKEFLISRARCRSDHSRL